MGVYTDVFYHSLIKSGEELCGDMVEVSRLPDSTIIVLSDGLGSGVKANILATLTSKIAATMLKEGSDIYETVDTIVKTLPVCKVRDLAYSTFTIIKIEDSGKVYMAEYDNPPFFLIRNGHHCEVPKKDVIIHGKTVSECSFTLEEGDVFAIVSDGVTHAGLGDFLNLGWKWEGVNDYLQKLASPSRTARDMVRELLGVCMVFDGSSPGDDTTSLIIKAEREKHVDLFSGPPQNPEADSAAIASFMSCHGKKIICGGTAANIASRELRRNLNVNMDLVDKKVPPTASMDGIDLITEGVLTLSLALEKIREYSKPIENLFDDEMAFGNDGASLLAKMLICECSHLSLWIGKAVNPAHQNPDFPLDLSIKLNKLLELRELLEGLGRKVTLNFV